MKTTFTSSHKFTVSLTFFIFIAIYIGTHTHAPFSSISKSRPEPSEMCCFNDHLSAVQMQQSNMILVKFIL